MLLTKHRSPLSFVLKRCKIPRFSLSNKPLSICGNSHEQRLPSQPKSEEMIFSQLQVFFFSFSFAGWWHGGSCRYNECAECHFNRSAHRKRHHSLLQYAYCAQIPYARIPNNNFRDCRYGEYCNSGKKCVRQLRDANR